MNKEIQKIIGKISYTNMNELLLWHDILEHFPITKKYKIKLIRNSSQAVAMGVLVDHLMSVAEAVGVPGVYIRGISDLRRRIRILKKGVPDADKLDFTTTLKWDLIKETQKLLEATRVKVLQIE